MEKWGSVMSAHKGGGSRMGKGYWLLNVGRVKSGYGVLLAPMQQIQHRKCYTKTILKRAVHDLIFKVLTYDKN